MSEIVDITFLTNAPEFAAESRRIEGAITGVERRTGAMSKETVESSRKMEESGKRVDGMYKQLGSTLAKLGGTIAIATLAKQLYDFANAFDKSMTEVATISATVTDNMESFTQQVLAMGTRVPIAADAAAKALYQIVSAGYDGAAGMNLLEVSAKSAIAGMTDTTTAADAITTSLNAYKKDAQEAAQVSDLLFMTAKLGKTTFGQLGQSISQAAPIAAAYGVELEQVLAAVATLTKSGTPTAQAMTQIRAAIIGVSKYLGDGAYDVMTFQEALDSIAQKAGGSEDALRSMITETEAISGVLGLTGINARMAADDLAAMGGAAGETEKAFAKMNDKVDNQMVILKNNMLKKFHEAGAGALDVVGDLTKFINNAFETGAIDNVIATMGVLIATLGVYKASILAANAVNIVGNNLKYTAEIAELQKLLGVKEVAKLSDVEQLVVDGRMTKSQADKVLAIRAQVQAKLDDLRVTAQVAKAEALSAATSHKAALQEALASKSMVTQRQLELSLAQLSGNAADIELAKESLLEAQEQRHIAVKARKATADTLSVANSRATAAATAVETFQQNINTASTTAGAKAKGLMTMATMKLTTAFKALKLAFATNPFGLIITGVTLAVSAFSLFGNKAKETSSVISELDAATSQYDNSVKALGGSISRYDELQAKAKTSAGLTKDEHTELNSIMETMLTTVPNLKGKFDEYGNTLSVNIDTVKSFSKAQKEAYKDVLQAGIQAAEQEKRVLEGKMEAQRKIFMDGERTVSKTRFKGQFGGTESYSAVIGYSAKEMQDARTEWSKLNADMIAIGTSITSSKNVLDGVNDSLSTGGGSKEPAATPEMYGANYKAAQKEWEVAKKELAAIEKDKDAFTQEQYDAAKKREADAQAAFASKGGVTKDATPKKDDKEATDRQKNIDAAVDAERTLKESLVAIIFETEQAVIDAKEAGFEKEMAQIELNYRKKQTEIEMQEREQRQKVVNSQKTAYVAGGGKAENFKVDSTDAALAPIAHSYDAKTKANSAEQANATKTLLDGIRQQWQGWGDEYQKIEDEITEVARRAAHDRASISAAVKSGNITKEQGVQAKETVNKGEETAIADLNSSKTKLSESWTQVFRDLEGMSRSEVNILIDSINEQLKNSKLAPADASALFGQLQKAKEYSVGLNPFAGFIQSLADVKDAKKEVAAAELDLGVVEKVGTKEEVQAARERAKLAKEELKNSKNNRDESAKVGVSEVAGVANATSDLLKNFGVESPAVDGVVNSLSALGEINFSNPMSIITGGLKAVSSLLGGIFGEMDAVKERKIQEIQKQVDALDKSYEKLGEEVDKAYSTDASQLIGQQNEMLEQQKKLIDQQIKEEEGKKKSDDSKVAAYKKAQDDINKKIKENKEAATDAIFGSDLQSAIDNFASAYMAAWGSGEDRAKSQKDVVKQMKKDIIKELMKKDIEKEVAAMRKKIEGFMVDNVLSDWELKEIDKMGDEVGEILDKRAAMYEKAIGEDDTAKNEDSLTGAIRGTVATEASVSELGGIMRRDSDNIFKISNTLDLGFTAIAEMARTNVLIEANTRRTADNTDGLTSRIDDTNKKLDTVIKNTQQENVKYK